MKVEKLSMNWLPRASAYDQAVANREKRKAVHEEFLSNSASLANLFGELRTSVATEEGIITSRIALARVSKKA